MTMNKDIRNEHPNNMRELNWAVVGTGVIANQMAQALAGMDRRIYALWNRTYDKGLKFAEKYHVSHVYEDYDAMMNDPAIDVIYITTPHNTHYYYMEKALHAGKHVLCEKSFTLNSRELEEMSALAESKGLYVAEAQTIWHMPLYKELWNIVESGLLGKVQMITMNFGSFKDYDMTNRFFNMDLAGGATLDIGCYALSIIRSFMISKPDQIVSQWKKAPTGADEQVTALLMNKEGQMATMALSMHSKQPKRAMISCEKGYIEIMEYPRASTAFIVDAKTGLRTEVSAGDTANALAYELCDMERAILTGDASLLKLDYSRDVMEIMTALRKEWGMKYPGEEW